MSSFSTTLRPGLLVGLKTSITGNVKYNKQVIESDHITETGSRKAKWETERTVIDPVEHEAATKVRSKARSIVNSVCANTAFGLLCPDIAAEDLKLALVEARKLCDDFNRTAKLTRVYFNAITGRIAPDDLQAVRAINEEVRQLLAEMADGIQKLDVVAVRAAADRAKQIGAMLTLDAQARIQIAIDAARASATKIKAAGEQAAIEIDRRTLATLAEARTAFLDIDQPDREVAAPTAEGRSIDLAPEQGEAIKPVTPKAAQFEVN
jgi:hypothetical protein